MFFQNSTGGWCNAVTGAVVEAFFDGTDWFVRVRTSSSPIVGARTSNFANQADAEAAAEKIARAAGTIDF